MSAKHTKWVWNWLKQVNADRALPESAIRAAIVIADHHNEEDDVSFPGTNTIGAEGGMTQGAAHNGVRALASFGHLIIEPGKRGRGHSNRYRLIQKCPGDDVPLADGKYHGGDISWLVTGDDEIPSVTGPKISSWGSKIPRG